MALDPFIVGMLAKMKAAGQPPLTQGTPDEIRARVAAGRAVLGPGPEMEEVRTVSIPTRAGSIEGRLFRPLARPSGLLVYQHGGGWVVGTLDDYDTLARRIAAESGAAVLLTAYRLAPEHPFPAGLEDVEDAIRWAAGHVGDLVGRPAPIAVGGDSAGANLSTVALRRLAGRMDVALQILLYPVVDCDFDTPSYAEHGEGLPLTRADMQWFFQRYAPDVPHDTPDISPLRADALGAMPPTYIATAEYDVLCDEGEAYARKLADAGVPVRRHRYQGGTHGFARLHNLYPTADRLMVDVASELKQHFAR